MKINQKRLAVFDIDGTILDSARKIRQDVIDAFDKLGIPNISHNDVRLTKRWYDLLHEYGISEIEFDKAFDKRKSWEQALRDGDAPLFEDTIPCLEKLASNGVTLAALTRSLPTYTKAKLDYYNLSRYFKDRVAITDINAPSKEQEAHQLIKQIGKPNISHAYFIGDKAEDVTVAKPVQDRWQIDSSGIYVNRERKTIPSELTGYHIVENLSNIPEIILK